MAGSAVSDVTVLTTAIVGLDSDLGRGVAGDFSDEAYGYGRDRVATRWPAVSMRELDPGASTDAEPVHTFTPAPSRVERRRAGVDSWGPVAAPIAKVRAECTRRPESLLPVV